jgi:hypothetical protein
MSETWLPRPEQPFTGVVNPVGRYTHRFPFTGEIDRIEIELRPELTEPHHREVADGQFGAALASQ